MTRPIVLALPGALLIASINLGHVGQPEARWRLTISYTISERQSDHATFTDIRGVAVNKVGDVFVLDTKTEDIRMFNSRGEFVRTVTRQGHGPGELTNAIGMLTTPNGGFVVNDVANGRLTVWTPDGKYERQIPLMTDSYAYVWRSGWDAAQRIVETVIVYGGRGVPYKAETRRIGFTGGGIDTVPEPSCLPPDPPRTMGFTGARNAGPGMMIPFIAVQRKTIDHSGYLWCSPGGTYRAERYRIGSAAAPVVIARVVQPEVVSKRERDSAVAVVDSFARKWRGGNADPALIPTTKPAIEGLMVDDRGRLWVKRPGTTLAPTRYDVWDHGRLVAALESSLRLAREIPVVVVGDMFYAVAVDEDGVQSVVVAKITR